MEIISRAQGLKLGPEVRLVSDKGGNEIVKIEAVFDKAEEVGMDVVCVSDESKPAVVRIQDFRKLEMSAISSVKLKKLRTVPKSLKKSNLK
mgnify:CR=1 FL=1